MSKKKEDTYEIVRTSVANLGLGDWEEDRRTRSQFLEDYGICGNCTNFSYAASQFAVRAVACDAFRGLKLHPTHKIKECTVFSQRGAMRLHELVNIAKLIDPPPREVGFERGE